MGNYTFYADRPIEKYRRTDKGLLVSILLLWGLGIFTLYITTLNTGYRFFENRYYFVQRQLISSAIGFAGLIFLALLPINVIRKILPGLVIGAFVLCLLTFIPGIGIERKGARRWIKIPFLSTFQPSEAAKFAIVLFLANLFDKQNSIEENGGNSENSNKTLPAIIGLVVFVLVVFAQKDFSTGLFIFISAIFMFVMAGAKLMWIIPFAILALPGIFLMIAIEPYRINRVAAFLRPDEFSQTYGYQVFASQRAISAGGLWGSGLGTGLFRINSIPEVHADYIFAGWAEAMGLVGVIIYFIILGYFFYRAITISITCPDRFAAYGSIGFAIMITFQSLANCAVVCGVVPTTGIPLPFFSSGGSSIILTLSMCGFILNASHCDAPEFSYTKETKSRKTKIDDFNDVMVDL